MIALKHGLIPALVLALAGCAGSGSMTDDGGDGFDYGDGTTSGDDARSSGYADDGFMSGDEFGDSAAPGGVLENRVIYFGYDKADVDDAGQVLLGEHGRYMAEHPDLQVRLEGHGDERGSREYNIGLGERRAQAVRQILLLRGATVSQLSTVSYGEERPAALGSDEEAWSLNRRVEIIYNR